jgi:hypothetical protein
MVGLSRQKAGYEPGLRALYWGHVVPALDRRYNWPVCCIRVAWASPAMVLWA